MAGVLEGGYANLLPGNNNDFATDGPSGTPIQTGCIPANRGNPALLSGGGMTALSDRLSVAVRTALGSVSAGRPGAWPHWQRRRFVGLLRAPAG